ncbi:hypothetical protein EEW87_001965 [Janibacter melonis]|uniref:Uncharacterized protein n=1 Tax=Janibacter melonis TaxID=262209 RepID=A0A5P8FIJ1_9MICO|nr:hypothetical protein [Janibacter melonis]QFQ29355.2 hypothetical protein EEW87_001965 [Janibacter melonis]
MNTPTPEQVRTLLDEEAERVARGMPPIDTFIQRVSSERRRRRGMTFGVTVTAAAVIVGGTVALDSSRDEVARPAATSAPFPVLERPVTILPVGAYQELQVSETGCPYVTVPKGDPTRAAPGKYVLATSAVSGWTLQRDQPGDTWSVRDRNGSSVATVGDTVVHTPEPGLKDVLDSASACSPMLAAGAQPSVFGAFNPPAAP